MPQLECCLDKPSEINFRSGMQIEDQDVWTFDIVDSRTPRMNLHDIYIYKPKEAWEVINPDTNTFSTVAFSNR